MKKFCTLSFSIFLHISLEGRRRVFKREREGNFVTNHEVPCHQPHVGRMWHTWAEEASSHVTHGLYTWPSCLAIGQTCSSRTYSTFFGRIQSSKLRFQICIQITNCHSLMHDNDYKTLTKG